MHETELERLARQLAEGLRGKHDAFCREMLRLLARGRPVTAERLASALQMSGEQVAEVLAGLADLEVDQSGSVVRWGLTFIPTSHRFRVQEQQFYTWCALDALIYPTLQKRKEEDPCSTHHLKRLLSACRSNCAASRRISAVPLCSR